MKIVMLCDFYGESLAYQENLLTRYYIKHGHQVTVIASTFESVFDFVNDRYDPSRPESVFVSGGAKIIRLPYRTNLFNRARTYRNLTAILDAEAPQLVFVHDIMLNLPDAIAYVRRHQSARMILDYHADYSNSAKNWLSLTVLHGIIRKRVLRMAQPYLSRIFPVTPASARFLSEVYGIRDDDMEILPLGTDMDLARRLRERHAGKAVRSRLGIPQDDLVIVTGGKLTPGKRTELLIEALAGVSRLNAWLVIVGDAGSSDHDYLSMLKAKAANAPHVIFTGWLEDHALLAHIEMADVAAFPASQSILWQHAVGMGKPLVIGDRQAGIGGTQDVSYMNTYGNILIARGEQPTAAELTSMLTPLLDSPDLRKKMSTGALRVAGEILDWNRLIQRTLEPIYERAMGSQPI
jgi:glycosyltransferase involved in cell wall biosynthesis